MLPLPPSPARVRLGVAGAARGPSRGFSASPTRISLHHSLRGRAGNGPRKGGRSEAPFPAPTTPKTNDNVEKWGRGGRNAKKERSRTTPPLLRGGPPQPFVGALPTLSRGKHAECAPLVERGHWRRTRGDAQAWPPSGPFSKESCAFLALSFAQVISCVPLGASNAKQREGRAATSSYTPRWVAEGGKGA